MRVNGHDVVEVEPAPAVQVPEPEPELQQGDLFGHAPASRSPSSSAPVQATSAKPAQTTAVEACEPREPSPALDQDRLRGVTTEDLESFKALGVEVCFTCAAGEVWLVPEPPGQPRFELTPEHAATVVQVLAALPGAQVVSLTSKHEPEGSKEVIAP